MHNTKVLKHICLMSFYDAFLFELHFLFGSAVIISFLHRLFDEDDKTFLCTCSAFKLP